MPGVANTISGLVLDATGHPAAQVRVFIVKAPGPVPDVAALTGADGRFALAATRAGTY
ncbi:MAG: Carboxypeptidase regulatory-like domain, partial [Ramlibacter sp.]|nr:Carboxypeptidase regulatory-like domain [Ramlibacter sp.]